MRDRAFGVEIECGYYGEGEAPECTCECYCESERRSYQQANDYYESLTQEQRAQQTWRRRYTPEQIAEVECEFCRYGCEGGCTDGYDDDEGCNAASRLLERNGFEEWLDDIHPDGSGVEIPSPILRGPQGMRDLRRVMELLSSNGFRCTTSDGLHVHHDAPEFAKDEALLVHTVELWEENLDHIRRFVDPQRRNTTWASSRTDRGQSPQYNEFKKTKQLSALPSWRTCAMNIEPVKYGSEPNIEIRLHEGTLDFRKAAAWIHFGQAFLYSAIRSYERKREVRVCADVLDVLRMTNLRGNSRRTLMEVAALS